MTSGIASCVISGALLFVPLHAVIVDRIVITVDREVITALQLEEEIRVTAFIEHAQPNFELESRRQAADRLLEQVLVKREMQVSRYPGPSEADVTAYLDTIIKDYGGEESFRSSLAQTGLSERVLRNHLSFQLTTLRFLDYRFKPDVDVSEPELRADYDKEAEALRKKGGLPPTFEDSREALTKKILNERVESEFSAWLEETRKEVQVTYLEQDLQ